MAETIIVTMHAEFITDDAVWATMVEAFKDRSIFHTDQWISVIENATQLRAIRLVVVQDSRPILLLPLFLKEVAGMKALLSPPPGLAVEYMGPVYNLPEDAKRDRKETMALEATKTAFHACEAKFRPSMFYIRCSPSVRDVRPWEWLGFAPHPLYTYEIDLTMSPAMTLVSFKRELRYALSSKWDSVAIQEVGLEGLDSIYSFVRSRYQNQEMRFHVPRPYIEALFGKLAPNHMRALVARVGGDVAGGIVVLSYNGRMSAWIGARSRYHVGVPVMDLLIWNAMTLGRDSGIERFELMGANTPRLRSFMAKYNPSLETYFELEKSGLLGALASSIYRRLKGPDRGAT